MNLRSIITVSGTQSFPDAVRKIQKFRGFPDVQSPVRRKVTVDAFDDPTRSWRHHHDPGGEICSFRDRMGDKNNGFPILFPESQEMLIQLISDDFIERAERLVHQKQFRIKGQCPGNRNPLLHPAGKLPRKLFLEAFKVDHFQAFFCPSGSFRSIDAHDFQRQFEVSLHRPPGK